MTTTTPTDLPEALRLDLEALEHSEPTHKHYAEPRERHAQAIAAARAALSAAAPAVAPQAGAPAVTDDDIEVAREFLADVHNATQMHSALGQLRRMSAQVVEPKGHIWHLTRGQLRGLIAELQVQADAHDGDVAEADETELCLSDSPAGTVRDDERGMNESPLLTLWEAEYPEEGVYPIDPSACRSPEPQPPAALPGGQDALEKDRVSLQRRAFIRGWDNRGMAHGLKGGVDTDDHMRKLMNALYPRAAMAAKGRTDGGAA